jgi:dephospho-CoA kinase
MLIVGLTGGIASGKTTVARMLKNMGARVIDADAIGREVMMPHTDCWKRVVNRFGEAILQKDGTIDRKKLASQIFSDPAKRLLLNRTVHPFIRKRIKEMIQVIGRTDPAALVIVDAALLVETGMYRDYDKLVVVAAAEDVQIARIMRRNHLSVKDARSRIRAQLPLDRKKKVADYIIINQHSLEHTRRQTRSLVQELCSVRAVSLAKRSGSGKCSFGSRRGIKNT